eukprot:scaffold26288_cov111-Isochrysis_galbana.AAC.12
MARCNCASPWVPAVAPGHGNLFSALGRELVLLEACRFGARGARQRGRLAGGSLSVLAGSSASHGDSRVMHSRGGSMRLAISAVL